MAFAQYQTEMNFHSAKMSPGNFQPWGEVQPAYFQDLNFLYNISLDRSVRLGTPRAIHSTVTGNFAGMKRRVKCLRF